MEIPTTLPVSPLHPDPSSDPSLPAFIKPLDIAGCAAWLETHSDGTLVNKLTEHAGKIQTVIASSDPLNPERGVLMIFDRELTTAERQFLADYAHG